MINPYRFIVTPLEGKYRTTKIVNNKTLYLTSSIEDAKYVSRIAVVLSVPLFYDGSISIGDTVVIHHNIFRDYYNKDGKVSSSSNYINYNNQDLFLVAEDLIYLYKPNKEWIANKDYCFVRPLKKINKLTKTEVYDELKGIIVFSNHIEKNTKIGFTPDSEYEFEINNETLYMMNISDICLL